MYIVRPGQDYPDMDPLGGPLIKGGLAQLLSPLRQITTSLPNQIKDYTQREIQSALDQQQTPSPDPVFTDPNEGIVTNMPVDLPDIFNPPPQQLPTPMPGNPFMGGIFGGNPPPGFDQTSIPGLGRFGSGINRAQLEALFAARQRQQPQGMPSPIAGLPSIFNTAAGAM
mgnify:CR=1 FL=1